MPMHIGDHHRTQQPDRGGARIEVRTDSMRHLFMLDENSTTIYYSRTSFHIGEKSTLTLEAASRRAAVSLLLQATATDKECHVKATVLTSSIDGKTLWRTIAIHKGRMVRREADEFLSLLEVRPVPAITEVKQASAKRKYAAVL